MEASVIATRRGLSRGDVQIGHRGPFEFMSGPAAQPCLAHWRLLF